MKTHTRIATRAESLRLCNNEIPRADRDAMQLPNGHPDSCRLILNAATSAPMTAKDGRQQYCAPWLLAGIFCNP